MHFHPSSRPGQARFPLISIPSSIRKGFLFAVLCPASCSTDSVWAWHKAQVLDRPGRKERCKPVYDNYVEWCEDNNLEALTFPKFSAVLKDEIGVKKQDTHNRHFYVDIGIRPKLRVVGVAQVVSA